MRPWAVIARKEVKEQLRSRKTLLTLVITPILVWLALGVMYAFIFGSMAPSSPMAKPLDMYLTVEDNGPFGALANATIYAVAANMNVVVHEIPAKEGMELVEEGKAVLYVRVPANFTESLTTTGVGVVEIWVDPTSTKASAVAGAIEAALKALEMPRYHIMADEKPIRKLPFTLLILSMMLVMSAIYGPMPVITTSFAGEREKKTLEVLLATPVRRSSILLGKLLAAGFAAAIYMSFNVVGLAIYNAIMSWALAGLELGPLAAPTLSLGQALVVIASAVLTMFLSASLGMAMSCLAKTVKDAETYYSTILMLPVMLMAMTFATPRLEDLPLALRLVLLAIPFTHGMLMINNAVIYGRPWPVIALNALYMLAWTAGALIVGAKLFEREEIVETRKIKRPGQRPILKLFWRKR